MRNVFEILFWQIFRKRNIKQYYRNKKQKTIAIQILCYFRFAHNCIPIAIHINNIINDANINNLSCKNELDYIFNNLISSIVYAGLATENKSAVDKDFLLIFAYKMTETFFHSAGAGVQPATTKTGRGNNLVIVRVDFDFKISDRRKVFQKKDFLQFILFF